MRAPHALDRNSSAGVWGLLRPWALQRRCARSLHWPGQLPWLDDSTAQAPRRAVAWQQAGLMPAAAAEPPILHHRSPHCGFLFDYPQHQPPPFLLPVPYCTALPCNSSACGRCALSSARHIGSFLLETDPPPPLLKHEARPFSSCSEHGAAAVLLLRPALISRDIVPISIAVMFDQCGWEDGPTVQTNVADRKCCPLIADRRMCRA